MEAKQKQPNAFASFFAALRENFAALREKQVSRKGTKEDAKALRVQGFRFTLYVRRCHRRVVSIKFAREERAGYRFDPSPVC